MTGIRIGAGLLVGLLTGVAGLVVCRREIAVGGVVWPWGLVVTLLAVPVVVAGVGRAGAQGAAWSAAVGWFLPVALPVVIHPGGDQIPGQDTTGLAYLVMGLIVVVATVTLFPERPPVTPAGGSEPPPGSETRPAATRRPRRR